MVLIHTVVCMMITFALTKSELTIYPAPSGVTASEHFQVKVRQGRGNFQNSFVYISRSNNRMGQYERGKTEKVKPNRTISWTSFDFDGDAVTVKVETARGFDECLVRPRSYGLTCRRISRNTALFTMNSNTQKVSIEFDYDYGSRWRDITDKLVIFANPLEEQVPVPWDPAVWFYDQGIHDLDGLLSIPSSINKVYLAPGSYVKGGFKSSHRVTIMGRGILTGADYPFKDSRFPWALIEHIKSSFNQTVEGITLVDSPKYFYRGLGDNNVIRNVKCLGSWTHNTDGVVTGKHGLIEDSFFHTNDDTIKVYHDGLTVRRCVIWQAQNGAVFQFGWWKRRRAVDVFISDIDVIHTDWCTFKGEACNISPNNAVLNLRGKKTKHFHVSNINFSNIRIEGQCPRVIYFVMHPEARGYVSNIRLNNWSVEAVTPDTVLQSKLKGSPRGGILASWFLNNITIAGRCISDPLAAGIDIDRSTVRGIQFVCP